MKMNMKKTITKSILNKRGSAIIMALVIITMLILLGLAVATLSMGTLISNTEDAENNEAYYAADAGVNSGIEQIKYEVSKYYSDMLEAKGAAYNTLYNNFFAGINNNVANNFVEPDILGITTVTTFTTGTYDNTQDLCEFLISCKSTSHDGTGYVINGAVYIKKVDVVVSSGNDWLSGGDAIKAGGIFNLGKKNSAIVSGGNIHVGELSYKVSNTEPIELTNGKLIIDPALASSMSDMLSYPSYTDPSLSNVDLHITKNNSNINFDAIGKPPITVTSDEGINLHIKSCTVPEGIIHIKGNVKISNCVFNADIYCDGNLKINNTSFNGKIYCRGNVNINNANANINGAIYCDGSVKVINCSVHSSIYSGGGISCNNLSIHGNLYSSGKIKVTNYSLNGIVYSSEKLEIGGGSLMGVLFSAGDIKFLGSLSIHGAVIAINDVSFKNNNKVLTVNYSQALIDYILNDPNNSFFFGSSASEPALDEDVFIDQNITAQGRVN